MKKFPIWLIVLWLFLIAELAAYISVPYEFRVKQSCVKFLPGGGFYVLYY